MIELKSREMFFDRAAVISALEKARLRVLSKFGAFVRTRARSSIRKRKRTASAGQPPSSHVGTLKDLIYFAFDQAAKSVVIGPERFGRGTAPAALEYGGSSLVEVTGTGVSHAGRRTKRRVVTYEARPFMGPAFETEAAKLPSLFLDSI